MAEKRQALGKGLGALIPTELLTPIEEEESKDGERTELDIASIEANRYQPRTVFDKDKLEELANSIKENGIFQPVLVRPKDNGYELIAGERRLRAATMAGLKKIPAIIKEMSDQKAMELAIIENIQREDLNPIEEAKAYKRLGKEFDLTQDEIAKKLGKSRPYVANITRLLALPEEVLNLVESGALTVGHVRPLLSLEDEAAIALANRLVEEKSTAREAELLAKRFLENGSFEDSTLVVPKDKQENKQKVKPEKPVLSPTLRKIQDKLRDATNTKVSIVSNGNGGKIVIDYYTEDDIQRLMELITGKSSVD